MSNKKNITQRREGAEYIEWLIHNEKSAVVPYKGEITPEDWDKWKKETNTAAPPELREDPSRELLNG